MDKSADEGIYPRRGIESNQEGALVMGALSKN